MSLDVIAYRNVEFIETVKDVEVYEEKYDYKTNALAYVNDDFPGRADPIVHHGVYQHGEDSNSKFSFAAGSYSGYNHWRVELCKMALHVDPDVVWNARDQFSGKPFYELIDFSDCEGVIGSVVARKLTADFAEYQRVADQYDCSLGDWFQKQYKNWRKAFEMAADNGYVDFH